MKTYTVIELEEGISKLDSKIDQAQRQYFELKKTAIFHKVLLLQKFRKKYFNQLMELIKQSQNVTELTPTA